MLQVSDRAMSLLKETLLSERQDEGEVFRLSPSDDRLGLRLARAELDDIRYEQDGTVVLVATVELANALDGATIDFEDSDDGPSLIITETQ
jgi:Fe-S cluster assembly iron-binding protein IscA